MAITNTETKKRSLSDMDIEASEARGQKELLNSSVLPCEIRGRSVLESAGVKFGRPLKDDPLFCEVTLPEGWTKTATEHSMWSELLDNFGSVRAEIFYKAAYYDRRAFIQAVT